MRGQKQPGFSTHATRCDPDPGRGPGALLLQGAQYNFDALKSAGRLMPLWLWGVSRGSTHGTAGIGAPQRALAAVSDEAVSGHLTDGGHRGCGEQKQDPEDTVEATR